MMIIGELSRHMCLCLRLSMPAESGKGPFLGVGGMAYGHIKPSGPVTAPIMLVN